MKILFSAILITLVLSYSCGVIDINDSNYHDFVYSVDQNWILTFTLPTCPHCKKALDSLNKVADEAEEEDNQKFSFGKINCSESNYLCITYNIQAVPHIVKIVNGRKIIMKSYPSYETLKSFLFVEHDETEGEPTPKIIGVLDFGLRMMQELIKASNEFMNHQLKERGFQFEWNSYMSVGLFVAILLGMIGIEILIIFCFCSKRLKEQKKVAAPKQEEATKQEEAVKEKEENKEINEAQPEPQPEAENPLSAEDKKNQ